MPEPRARILVLGSKDFDGFRVLDGLPQGVEVVGLGLADDALGLPLAPK